MEEFQKIFELIESRTGIEVNVAHREHVVSAVAKRISELEKEHTEINSVDKYISFIEQNESEENVLIDIASINETYFFREESQFDFLKEKFFPSFAGKQISIWSAACSSGEESVSLYALAKSTGCMPTIFATDIDAKILDKMKTGLWPKSSFRGDGKKYANLLEEIGTTDGSAWSIRKEDFLNFHISQFNLISNNPFPMPLESVDLIFIRNVFIYFKKKNQYAILKKMWQALKPGGLLFLSVSEVASIDNLNEIPFSKEHTGSVYYFRKVSEAELKKINEEKKSKWKTFSHESAAKKNLKENHEKNINITIHADKEKHDFDDNSSLKTKSENQLSIEELGENVIDLISEKKYDEAKNLLENYSFKSQNIEYKFYLYSRLYDETGEKKEALAVLSKASIANPKFWPAYFKLGLLYQDEKQTAKEIEAFEKCRELIKKSMAENKTEYNFIVEDFDLSYFLNLCDYYLGT